MDNNESEENITLTTEDLNAALNSEREIDKLREEFKAKCQQIRDRNFNIRKALQERVCYLLNMSYLKGYREGISPMDRYMPSKGTYERYLKEDFVLSDDGKYVAFKDDGNYCSSTYIIPIDVILSNDPKKDKDFSEYVEAFTEKVDLDYYEKQYKEKKDDLDYWKQQLDNKKKKFNSLHKDIFDKSEWNIDLEGFQHEGKRLEEYW